MTKPRVLNVSFTLSAREPRLMRQVNLLHEDCAVTVMGRGDAPRTPVEFLQISPPPTLDISPKVKRAIRAVIGHFDPRQLPGTARLLAGRFEEIYWADYNVQRSIELTRNRRFDLVIAHDIRVLPAALRIANGAPLLYDAHEYAPRQYEEDWWWRATTGRMYDYLCRTYLKEATSVVTVAEGIATEYERVYGVRPFVVRNSPYLQSLEPSAMASNRVRLIHHGGANQSRRIETFIEAMALLDNKYTLDLILVDNGPYVQKLRRMAASDRRIRFVDPVPMDEICRTINRYDVGLFCIPPVSFNQENCLPNKVFEYVQARLAIASGPTREAANIIRQHGLGVIADGFDAASFAAAIKQLTPVTIPAFKKAAHVAAPLLSFEHDARVLRAEIDRLLRR